MCVCAILQFMQLQEIHVSCISDQKEIMNDICREMSRIALPTCAEASEDVLIYAS